MCEDSRQFSDYPMGPAPWRGWAVAMALLAVVAGPLGVRGQSAEEAVVSVVDAYHEALASGDSATALSLLTDDVTILESGAAEDKEHYRSGHLSGDMRFAAAVPRERSAVRVTVIGDVAWAWSTSTAQGRMGERQVNSRGAELIVLSRVGDRWLIRAIHWSSRSIRSAPSSDAVEQPTSGAPHDPALLESILEDVRVGWEQGDGSPFHQHFLDWDGARYFEGGGENVGLQDLVVNHVEPEAELGLTLGFSNTQTHFEGDFAWAVVDTEIQLTTADGRDIHNRGHGTYLFRWVDGAWKIVHTQSASSPVR